MNPVRELKKIAIELNQVQKKAEGESLVTDLIRALEIIGENAKNLTDAIPTGTVLEIFELAEGGKTNEGKDLLKKIQEAIQ